jgi:hypothetical protein
VYCDAHALVQLAVAVVMLGATAMVIRRLDLPMLATQTSARTPQFWWMIAAFTGPLGVANRVLFCDGLFLQIAIIVAVAGAGIWLGDQVLARLR